MWTPLRSLRTTFNADKVAERRLPRAHSYDGGDDDDVDGGGEEACRGLLRPRALALGTRDQRGRTNERSTTKTTPLPAIPTRAEGISRRRRRRRRRRGRRHTRSRTWAAISKGEKKEPGPLFAIAMQIPLSLISTTSLRRCSLFLQFLPLACLSHIFGRPF